MNREREEASVYQDAGRLENGGFVLEQPWEMLKDPIACDPVKDLIPKWQMEDIGLHQMNSISVIRRYTFLEDF